MMRLTTIISVLTVALAMLVPALPVQAQVGDGSEIMSCSAGDGGDAIVASPKDASACNSDVTAPCFAQVDDILVGRRHLPRADDLVVSNPTDYRADGGYDNQLFDTTSLTPETPVTGPALLTWRQIWPRAKMRSSTAPALPQRARAWPDRVKSI